MTDAHCAKSTGAKAPWRKLLFDMRIVMMTTTYAPHVGDVARSVEAFAAEYRRRGHQVLVVCPEFENAPKQEPDVVRVPAIQRFNGSDFSVVLVTPRAARRRRDLRSRPHPFAPSVPGGPYRGRPPHPRQAAGGSPRRGPQGSASGRDLRQRLSRFDRRLVPQARRIRGGEQCDRRDDRLGQRWPSST